MRVDGGFGRAPKNMLKKKNRTRIQWALGKRLAQVSHTRRWMRRLMCKSIPN